MSVENDFLPFAAEPGANVVVQGTYAGSGFQTEGQQPGIALSTYFNRVWRQGSMGMAVIAAFIVSVLNQAVLDSGYASGAVEVTTLLGQFKTALLAFVANSTAPQVVAVPFSATPAFNCTAGNLLLPVFEITLTGNVTAPTLANAQPGQNVAFIIHQDATGGRTFAWPGVVQNGGAVDPTAISTSVQTFVVQGDGTLQAVTGITG